jgi:hypothetical protein
LFFQSHSSFIIPPTPPSYVASNSIESRQAAFEAGLGKEDDLFAEQTAEA